MIGGTMLGPRPGARRDHRRLPDHLAGLRDPAAHPAERHAARSPSLIALRYGEASDARHLGADGRRPRALPDDPGRQLRRLVDRRPQPFRRGERRLRRPSPMTVTTAQSPPGDQGPQDSRPASPPVPGTSLPGRGRRRARSEVTPQPGHAARHRRVRHAGRRRRVPRHHLADVRPAAAVQRRARLRRRRLRALRRPATRCWSPSTRTGPRCATGSPPSSCTASALVLLAVLAFVVVYTLWRGPRGAAAPELLHRGHGRRGPARAARASAASCTRSSARCSRSASRWRSRVPLGPGLRGLPQRDARARSAGSSAPSSRR